VNPNPASPEQYGYLSSLMNNIAAFACSSAI